MDALATQPQAVELTPWRDRVRSAWGELLVTYPWDYFLTLTLSNRYSRVGVFVFRSHVHQFFRRLFFLAAIRNGGACADVVRPGRYSGALVNAYKRGRGRFVYVFGLEPHRSGQLHAHALCFIPRFFNHWLEYQDVYKAWAWGGVKGERPTSQEDVADYVSKYVVKGGEIEVSQSFQFDALRRLNRAT